MIPGRPMAGITAGNPDFIDTQRRISQLDSNVDPKKDELAQYLIMLTQQNKVGTPEYFMAAGEYAERENTRKEQQAKQADQPPVINRLIASAAQETAMNRGVAAVPAPNVGGYAPGGIVAFSNGGQPSVGPAMMSTIKPGPGVSFSQAFPGAAATTASRMPGLFGRIGALTLGPLGAFEAMTGPSGDDIDRLKEFERAKEILRSAGFTDKDISALPSKDVYRMASGYGYKPSQPDVRTAGAPTPVPVPAPAPEAPPPAPEAKPPGISALLPSTRPDYGSLMANVKSMTGNIMGAAPTVPTDQSALTSEKKMYEEAGVDFGLFKRQIAEERKALEASKGDRTEAANLRLIEAGLGILGGESPHAFVNIGKGASPAVKGFAEDIKELKKIERDRNKAIRDLEIADNQLAQGLGKSASDRKAKAEKRLDDYNERTAMIQSQMANTLFSNEMQAYLKGLDIRSTEGYRTEALTQNKIAAAQETAAKIMNSDKFSGLKAGSPEYEAAFNSLVQMLLRQGKPGESAAGTRPNIAGRFDAQGNLIK
jgi:hypothetical protein